MYGLAMLSLGALFSAVRIPGRLVQAVAVSTDPQDIDAVLEEALQGGPVICDVRGPRYYALVPPSVPRTWREAVEDWQSQEVECLGSGTYLGVPVLDAVDFPRRGNGSYWAVPMASAGSLCRPLSVARLVAAGVHALDEARALWPTDAPLTPRLASGTAVASAHENGPPFGVNEGPGPC
ncbi:hypothetical protein [Streptomyces sp. SID5910]|uniref:hypothetical protein n=1 Tax=Streptomyces sp. SID5910 TaxID=2690312 RepID=UPI00136E5A2E|nr:hypothetical protein [Streptomyces sp. SID5910]MYR40886.1 hypothetical protein [Streptomyces sp. SID5910]